MEQIRILPGHPWNKGAVYADGGVNFCVFSRNATAIELNLFKKSDDSKPYKTILLDSKINRTGDLWHVFVAGLKPGALYLYRVFGPFEPSQGHRFDSKRYLYDPKAYALTEGSLFKNETPCSPCPLEKMPKCVVVDHSSYEWNGDKPLSHPLNQTIIYELHLKGFTASKTSNTRHPGTYRGAIEKIPYLKDLGITAVELMPVQEFDEYENTNVNPQNGKRLVNYWGYSTVCFFAPKASYSSNKKNGQCVNEFKDMVKAFHKAGIEVILDVVFNHTAEGNENGVSLNFRGFDNSIYYQLVANHKNYYLNFSGCGNSLNCNHPVVQDYIIDCLRYWVREMHIDGFRFDLASVMSRDEKGFLTSEAPLPRRISEDPVLRDIKIIAESWDAAGAYQVGSFPGGRWCEWNDKFRDSIRQFIRGDENFSTQAATRISGSSDLYQPSHRKPIHSINYVCSHDGFTMNDLVSFNYKHNEQNGEENRDGTNSNFSFNNGFEGETSNPKIESTRLIQIKNFFVALLLSQGVPMFLMGDEVRRSQGGNNNLYCHDSESAYFNWNNRIKNAELFSFVKALISLRMRHRVFTRTDFFEGQKSASDISPADITWFNYDGLTPDWSKMNKFLAFRLGGGAGNGKLEEDCDFYVAFNTNIHDITVRLPLATVGKKWFRVLDTSIEGKGCIVGAGNEEEILNQEKYVILSNSVVVLVSK
ncbi:glycogen debranching protein GlgX [Treponema pectinovorum]|uniref:glycogen debranching protein GlgX n=1 Tax=Treponema pectinovorum TaxID=164 RepID=UPI0011CB5968|nr:glycogen debranching protein GlgX [Treponema pectinovorum]